MGLIKSELSIVTLKELLKLNLAIPEYQRPYRWKLLHRIHCLWTPMKLISKD